MASDASQALGSRELAGTFVTPKGLTKQITASVAGSVIGGVAGRVAANMTGSADHGARGVPPFGRVGYIAVSQSEVALVKTRTGLFKMTIGTEVLARVPRTEVAAAELDQGTLLSHLKIAFSNGVSWEFDVPLVNKKTARSVVQALGGTLR